MREHHTLRGSVRIGCVHDAAALVDTDSNQPVIQHPFGQLATNLQKLAPGYDVLLKIITKRAAELKTYNFSNYIKAFLWDQKGNNEFAK